jgi:hypothetical protein
MMMELYACGFNAWNQLLFDDTLEEEPQDLWLFQKALKQDVIDICRADFSSTLGKSPFKLPSFAKCQCHHFQFTSSYTNTRMMGQRN